ncbi:MAG: hypothetical protein HQL32_04300 [Planctomycetes bacterium]|nr:hypothetical protein [Planctomycetota bacterium]
MMKLISFLLLFSLTLLPTGEGAASAAKWMKSKYKVTQVVSGSSFAIDFNGISLVVKLVYLKCPDESKGKEYLSQLLSGQKVTIIPETSAGLSDNGNQQVYAFVSKGGKKQFINQQMIQKALAQFIPGTSKDLQKLVKIMEAAAKKAPKIETQEEITEELCSELYSRKYHKMSCRWAKMMNAQSKIIYDSYEAAEKADKEPCSSCLYQRLKKYRAEKAKSAKLKKSQNSSEVPTLMASADESNPHGSLFGIKGDLYFYSPVSKKIQKAKMPELIAYQTLVKAKKSGRRPDLASLRINNPVVPAPRGKECIGRALPFMRPCRRETTHPTGLCQPCLNGKVH